jgi:hypothetical protein
MLMIADGCQHPPSVFEYRFVLTLPGDGMPSLVSAVAMR